MESNMALKRRFLMYDQHVTIAGNLESPAVSCENNISKIVSFSGKICSQYYPLNP